MLKSNVFLPLHSKILKQNKMKKILLSIVFLMTVSLSIAQTTEKENLKKTEEATKVAADKPNGWFKKGTFTALFNQANFNNWLAGGQSNISINGSLNYDFNYKKDNITLDNKLQLGYCY